LGYRSLKDFSIEQVVTRLAFESSMYLCFQRLLGSIEIVFTFTLAND